MEFKKVSIIGLGYIGLPTASLLAGSGTNVVGVDINQKAVDTINRGEIHIVEPGLAEVVRSVVKAGKLRATTEVESSDAFIIAVPTPFKGENRDPDLDYIHAAAKAIAPALKGGNLVILESTSPVGTTEQLSRWLSDLRPDLNFPKGPNAKADAANSVCVAYCPERVLPGKILLELRQNDRVVGGLTPECARRASALYKTFVDGECFITNARTAEMVKLSENSFRDVNIAFANELSIICHKLGIDAFELIELANKHPRVNILQPGPGVGGHCISVDPWFIVSTTPKEAKLIHTARLVNDAKPDWVLERVAEAVQKVKDPAVACLGLAFKANIDDLRESPSVEIVERLAKSTKAKLNVVEPFVEELPKHLKEHSNVHFCTTKEAIRQSNIILLLVNHDEFIKIDRSELADKIVIDTRGVFR